MKRWSKLDKKHVNVECSAAVVTYNKNMGGVDTPNQLIEVYRTWFKTKKWPLKVTLHFLDLAVVNAWLLYRKDARLNKQPKKDTMDLLSFRIKVSETLLCGVMGNRVQEQENEVGLPKKPQNWRAPLLGVDKRTVGFDHWPVVDQMQNAKTCRLKNCASRKCTRCEKCNVYLCLTK